MRVAMISITLAGLAAGTGAGLMLAPPASNAVATSEAASSPGTQPGARSFVRIGNQFVVPLLEDGRVTALVVLGLGLEMLAEHSAAAHAREPRLRDAFLQVLFEHANAGGFTGAFTRQDALQPLRRSLREAAETVLGDGVVEVLIMDIMRQER